MRKMIAAFALILFLALPAAVHAQETTIRGPVSALRVEGNQLLIGQGTRLVMAQVRGDSVQVMRSVDLGRHDLRALATVPGIILALSEDGLTTLNADGTILAFAPGGGQRIVVNQGHVYIAALNAGVRHLKVNPAGKLTALDNIPTLGPASDVWPEANGQLWIAEGDKGIRLYDVRDPANPTALLWLGNLTPATVVRSSGTRLFIGFGKRLAVLDTLEVRTPRLLGTFALDGDSATVSDLVVAANRLYVGQAATADPEGADVLVLDIQNPKAILSVTKFGANSAGERLALSGSDLFIGSGRQGLRRVRFAAKDPVLITAWEPLAASAPCVASAPVLIQPDNGSEQPRGPVKLAWTSVCNAASYEVRINDQPVATVAVPGYEYTPGAAPVRWQVIAIDNAGRRTEGPVWTFATELDGWLAIPAPAPGVKLLYVPPLLALDLQSPRATLAITCLSIIGGLTLIVAAAWFIGGRAEQRRMNRLG